MKYLSRWLPWPNYMEICSF